MENDEDCLSTYFYKLYVKLNNFKIRSELLK